MCGIVGIVGDKESIDLALFERMRDTMHYRGPDDRGLWFNQSKTICFGHRRLSIIDTSKSGHQPMVDAESGHVIVFNGELYNYIEIRQELIKNGVSFLPTQIQKLC